MKKIDDADALKIKCLIHDTTVNSTVCPYRHYRRKYFGSGADVHCPHKYLLKQEWKQYLADLWNEEFEEDNPDWAG